MRLLFLLWNKEKEKKNFFLFFFPFFLFLSHLRHSPSFISFFFIRFFCLPLLLLLLLLLLPSSLLLLLWVEVTMGWNDLLPYQANEGSELLKDIIDGLSLAALTHDIGASVFYVKRLKL